MIFKVCRLLHVWFLFLKFFETFPTFSCRTRQWNWRCCCEIHCQHVESEQDTYFNKSELWVDYFLLLRLCQWVFFLLNRQFHSRYWCNTYCDGIACEHDLECIVSQRWVNCFCFFTSAVFNTLFKKTTNLIMKLRNRWAKLWKSIQL